MTEDKKLEELKMISHTFAQLYEYIYKKMGFVEGNEARTSATATVFISTKDEWKSAEYKKEQEARRNPAPTKPIPSPPPAEPEPEFKTAAEMAKETSAPPASPKTEAPKPDDGIFGKDRWGKTWPKTLVCMNVVAMKDDPNKLEYCHGVATVHQSITKGPDGKDLVNIFAICPKCNYFLKHDGKPGKKAQPQEAK